VPTGEEHDPGDPQRKTPFAFAAIAARQPHIATAAEFINRVDHRQRPEGYRLAGFFLDEEERAVAVAGFRLTHHFAWGKTLHCDDLSTLPDHRRSGHAVQLMSRRVIVDTLRPLRARSTT